MRKICKFLAASFVVLFLLRFLLVLQNPDFKYPDELVYIDIASHIAEENHYAVSPDNSTYAVRQAPGLPVALGLYGKIMPLTPLTVKLLNGFAGVLISVIYAFAAWVVTRRTGPVLVVLLLVGFHPSLLYTSITNYPQTYQGLWMALLVLVWARRSIGATPSVRVGFLDGCIIGIGALFVPTQIFVAPAAVVFHWRQGRSWLLRYVGFAALGGILILAPWTIRNLVAEHSFIPFSTNGGEQLYLGFNPAAGFNTGIQIELPIELRNNLAIAKSGKEVEGVFREAAIRWIRENPMAAVLLWGGKFLNFYRWDNGKMVTESERSPAREWIVRLTTLGVFGLAIVGGWRIRAKGPPWALTAAVLMLTLAAGHAFFISRYRYRIPFEPFLILVGVLGLSAWCIKPECDTKGDV